MVARSRGPFKFAARTQLADATVFDSETQLAFSSNGEGTLTVIHEDAP